MKYSKGQWCIVTSIDGNTHHMFVGKRVIIVEDKTRIDGLYACEFLDHINKFGGTGASFFPEELAPYRNNKLDLI